MLAATQTTNTDRIQHASALNDAKNTEQAILAYQSVLNEPSTNDQVLREQKVALIHLVRSLIDMFNEIPDCLSLQIEVCKEHIDWANDDKRIFLKQSLETRWVALYLDNKMYHESLGLISQPLKELKRLDDKMVFGGSGPDISSNISQCDLLPPPLLQAALDMQSGILHSEEKDYKTAYSYFYEAFEGYSSQEDAKAVLALKYMLLCKIMLNLAEDVHSIINGKAALRYAGHDIEAMKAIATAHQNRNLQEFESALARYTQEFNNDPIIRTQLAALYDTLLEQNLVRIIEPFSRVEIAHIADMVKLPAPQVEQKLSQMILNKAFHGILDQGAGCLIIFDEPEEDKTYETAIDTLKQVDKVVSSLYQKARQVILDSGWI
ncbi:hypothetical protein [Absidia glauca]|uniref:PCI domain-containing protein n=1 Tax=Absidia glauca TaxID=4829 RepID=A0A163MNV9_ABSGL|nr:hypothetical protein [Absidia glauca]